MMLTQIVVAAALVNGAGQVLVQQRRAGAQHGGCWEFPGGKAEAGEPLAEALVRELAEELGIAVECGALLPIGFSDILDGNGRLLLLLYRCDTWQGDVQCLDADAMMWIDSAHLGTLLMPPADVPLIAALLRSLRA